MNEYRILLNEITFTNICKSGYLSYQGKFGKNDINITKLDLRKLSAGEIITKDYTDEVVKIALQDIGLELIKEIIKRSPIYSDMYYEM
jgi:hypothetical protein